VNHRNASTARPRRFAADAYEAYADATLDGNAALVEWLRRRWRLLQLRLGVATTTGGQKKTAGAGGRVLGPGAARGVGEGETPREG
jgi:hypothetical protein